MLPSPKNTAVDESTSIPAPVGGLNARDSIADMDPRDAVVMENFFPKRNSVSVRNGETNIVSGGIFFGNSNIETIVAYNGLNNRKLLACAGAAIYDVASVSGGNLSTTLYTGNTSGRIQYTNVGTSGGQYVYMVNGVDHAVLYNGSTCQAVTAVSSPIAITGVDTSTLINVTLHKQRLWFIQANTCVVWYLAAGAIGGAANSIDLTQLFNLGGYLVAMATWTIDDASSINDYAAFITSEGEVALYNGTDPTSSTTWSLVGRFRIGRPIGYRCWEKAGGDVYMITVDGVFPLSKALLQSRNDLKDAVSDKIFQLLNADIQTYGGNWGWQIKLHPFGRKLIVNVPEQENSTYLQQLAGVQTQYQYVMNLDTGAWTKFTGWNANCFEVQADKLYYAGNSVLYQCDTGNADWDLNASAPSDINAKCKPAFNYFNAPGVNKMFTMVRPIISAAGQINPVLAINVDFQDKLPSSVPTYVVGGSPWDTSAWDTSPWSSVANVNQQWQTASGIGKCATIYLQTASQGTNVDWQATDFVYQKGGIL